MTETPNTSYQRSAVIVTVHGTNDGVHSKEGAAKWWEKRSDFVNRLTSLLAEKGLSVEIDEHLWSGANSAFARQSAAKALHMKMRKYAKEGEDRKEIHIVGHSHGGNVAIEMAELASWGRPRQRLLGSKPTTLSSLITVGTPFLRTKARNSDYFLALAFVINLAVAAIIFSVAPLFTAIRLFVSPEPPGWLQVSALIVSAMLFAVFSAMLWNQWSRFRWLARLRNNHPKRRKRGEPANRVERAGLLSIWHSEDEAIGALKRAESFSVELVPKGALLNNGHKTGVEIVSLILSCLGWIVPALMIFFLLLLIYPIGGSTSNIDEILNLLRGWRLDQQIFGIVFIGIVGQSALLLLGLIFYVPIVAFAGLVMSIRGRHFVNSLGLRVLRDFAFGGDVGQQIGDVSERPHIYDGEVWEIPPPLAKKMETETLAKLTEFLAVHRSSLFGTTVAADWMTHVAADDGTWKSLIHTTYFDHPEIAERIANHIAGASELLAQNDTDDRAVG